MKKLLLSFAAAALALCGYATEYNGQLSVNITDNDTGDVIETLQETTIQLEENDGKYSFHLNNFVLQSDETVIPVGNINVENLEATEAYGFKTLKFNDDVEITEGDLEDAEFWMGPLLGPVPIDLTAKFNDAMISVTIAIKLEVLPQAINVIFVGQNPEAQPGTQPQGNKFDVNGDNKVDVGDVNSVLEEILNPTVQPAE